MAETKIKWISCKEMMPLQYKTILFCTSKGTVLAGYYNGFQHGHRVFQSEHYTYWDNEVRYWAAFPSPPKEEQHG